MKTASLSFILSAFFNSTLAFSPILFDSFVLHVFQPDPLYDFSTSLLSSLHRLEPFHENFSASKSNAGVN